MELPEKLPKPAGYLACEKMSKRDWEAYFKKREKDHFVSKEGIRSGQYRKIC